MDDDEIPPPSQRRKPSSSRRQPEREEEKEDEGDGDDDGDGNDEPKIVVGESGISNYELNKTKTISLFKISLNKNFEDNFDLQLARFKKEYSEDEYILDDKILKEMEGLYTEKIFEQREESQPEPSTEVAKAIKEKGNEVLKKQDDGFSELVGLFDQSKKIAKEPVKTIEVIAPKKQYVITPEQYEPKEIEKYAFHFLSLLKYDIMKKFIGEFDEEKIRKIEKKIKEDYTEIDDKTHKSIVDLFTTAKTSSKPYFNYIQLFKEKLIIHTEKIRVFINKTTNIKLNKDIEALISRLKSIKDRLDNYYLYLKDKEIDKNTNKQIQNTLLEGSKLIVESDGIIKSIKLDVEGEGYFSNFLAYVKQGVRSDFPPEVRNFLARLGDKPITDLIVAKTPIWSAIEKSLNVISFNLVTKRKRKLNYDNLMHLYMVFRIENTTYRIEKNQAITIYEYAMKPDTQFKTVDIKGKNITLRSLLNNALQAEGGNLLIYDPVYANCQKFVTALLKHSRLLTPELNTFINQDIDKVLPKYAGKISRMVTDAAAAVDVILKGRGDGCGCGN